MKFKYELKRPATIMEKAAIENDIEQANEDYMETNKKIHKKCSGFMMRRLTKIPFLQQIAANSFYFSSNNVIKGISYTNEFVVIEVDDMLIDDIRFAESIGSAKVNIAMNYMKRLFGTTPDESKYTMKGFEKFLVNSLKVHGVEVIPNGK